MIGHMASSESAQPGDIRFTAIGDVEVFDGNKWIVVDPIADDPDGGMRPAPPPAPPAAGPPVGGEGAPPESPPGRPPAGAHAVGNDGSAQPPPQ